MLCTVDHKWVKDLKNGFRDEAIYWSLLQNLLWRVRVHICAGDVDTDTGWNNTA